MTMNLIAGIGNLILGDDAAGPLAVRALKERMEGASDNIHFREYSSFGIDLLHELSGYRRVAIIDSLKDTDAPYGEYASFSLEELEVQGLGRVVSSHGVSLPALWKLGEMLGMEMPRECRVFGIAGHEFSSFMEDLSPGMRPVFSGIVDRMEREITEWMN